MCVRVKFPAQLNFLGHLGHILVEGWVNKGDETARFVFLCRIPLLFHDLGPDFEMYSLTSTEPEWQVLVFLQRKYVSLSKIYKPSPLLFLFLFYFFKFHVCLMHGISLRMLSILLLHTYIYEPVCELTLISAGFPHLWSCIFRESKSLSLPLTHTHTLYQQVYKWRLYECFPPTSLIMQPWPTYFWCCYPSDCWCFQTFPHVTLAPTCHHSLLLPQRLAPSPATFPACSLSLSLSVSCW